MIENQYSTTRETDLWTAFTYGVNATTKFETIEEAYAWLKMMVNGFHGTGFFTK